MLYSRPTTYDAIYDRFVEDIPFYRALAAECDGPVCELACGTGRVTVPLALDGVEMIGIDSNATMLSQAEKRAREQRVPAGRILFAEGDMRYPPDDRRFGLVIIPLHSLSHLHTNEDVRACFSGIRSALHGGGKLAFAIHNPSPAVLARDPDELSRVNEGPSTIGIYESSRYDTAQQLLHLSWFVERHDRTERFDYALRMFFPQEILEFIGCAGFVLEGRYGWYDKAPFSSESGTQILVARKD